MWTGDLSAAWYRSIAEWAVGLPEPVHQLALLGTQGLLVLLGLLPLVLFARTRDLRALVPVVAGVAGWFLSQAAKGLFRQERPCAAVDVAATIAECPPPGDWSFPSSHATAAAAFAIGWALLRRRGTGVVVALAVLVAASRVLIGVHYPHDVLVGFAFGAALATALVRLAGARQRAGAPGPLGAQERSRNGRW
ncbi:phosphatase PAP2 family protein [Saccharopolyspora sp. CA-218241]|uniref:phosphatase PAP2 family protein n=1 Tax=Saccharopolyspora sp. CA-218241 TaxID=3240027 RepID=UPI003D954A25